MVTLTIVKKGWNEENINIPLVLLDKRTRTALGVQAGEGVSVSKNGVNVIAGVQLQFRELIGRGASINQALANALAVDVNDTIDIDRVITVESNTPPAATEGEI